MNADPRATPPPLVLLANDAMRARRRPLAIALLWAYEAVVALALAWPFVAFLDSQYGAHPQGDAPLWRPGALALLDLVARARGVGATLGAHATIALGAGVLLGLVPLAALLVSIAYVTPDRQRPPARRVLDRAARAFPAYLGLLLAVAFVQGALLFLGAVSASALDGALLSSLGEARAQQVAAIGLLAFALLALVAGVAHDLARAAVVRFEVGALRGLRYALHALRGAKARTLWSWGWRAVVSWIPVAIGAVVAHRFGGRTGAALVALTVMHQVIALSRVALRASWLAKALRLVDDAHDVLRVAP